MDRSYVNNVNMFCAYFNIVIVVTASIEWRRVRWVGHVASMGKREAYTGF
jgi:hypothetical protein